MSATSSLEIASSMNFRYALARLSAVAPNASCAECGITIGSSRWPHKCAQLDQAKVYPARIVTEVTPYTNFYLAEDYHQDNGITLKVNAGYVQAYDVQKVADLKALFPENWQDKPVLVFASNAS